MNLPQSNAWRWIKLGVLAGIGIVFVAALAGFLYERWARFDDRRRFPQVGRSFDIGGRPLNLYCIGEKAPVVVLNSGANAPGYEWIVVQPRIAAFARVCWWDRAGTGWSNPGPFPRTSETNAADLRALLKASGTPQPYVMVGASAGGHDVRIYNSLYPNEVAGAVLVDAAHEEEGERIGSWGRARIPPRWLWGPAYWTARILAATGAVRLFNRRPAQEPQPGWTPEQNATLAHLQRRPDAVAADISSGGSFINDALVRKSGAFGDKPLIVLTAGKPLPSPPDIASEVAAYQEVWKHELQPKLARLSTHGRQIIVENSTHDMLRDAPQAVIDAIQEVVNSVRR